VDIDDTPTGTRAWPEVWGASAGDASEHPMNPALLPRIAIVVV
jgi:hypothetical protein